MRILFLNWKDINNPEAGGAEVFTHEVAKRWAASGNDVTVFARSFRGAPSQEQIDGVRIVRRGGRFSTYRKARRWYVRHGRGRFDVVIDEINTRPFMAHAFATDAKVVALIHQLAAEVWTEEMFFPIGLVGRYFLEPRWLRRYRNVPTLTVSPSTESDLRRLGFHSVTVVSEGLAIQATTEPVVAEERPTLLFVGRLVRTKRPDHAVRAHEIVRRGLPEAQLWVVGDGYMRSRLEKLAGSGVTFFGRVSEEHKRELMRRAHVLLMPGVREGWGLVINEAAASGTPTAGYDIPGVRDAIVPGTNGVLVEPTVDALATGVVSVLGQPRLPKSAMEWARQFSWDVTAKAIFEALTTESAPVSSPPNGFAHASIEEDPQR